MYYLIGAIIYIGVVTLILKAYGWLWNIEVRELGEQPMNECDPCPPYHF